MNDCRAVGDSVVDSAEFQCDIYLTNLLIWKGNWLCDCPQEIFLNLKRVDFQLVNVIVERKARQDCLFYFFFITYDFSLINCSGAIVNHFEIFNSLILFAV